MRSFSCGLVDVEPGDVEDDRPAEKEAGRTGGQVVEAGKPVVERQLGRKHDRKEGAAFEADRTRIC